MDSILGGSIVKSLTSGVVQQSESRHSLVGSSPSFVIDHDDIAKGCSFRWLGSNKNVRVHPAVLSFFAKEWESLVGNAMQFIECYTEFSHKAGSRFRAHPNYRDEGAWYDWALVRFVSDGDEEEGTSLFGLDASLKCDDCLSRRLSMASSHLHPK